MNASNIARTEFVYNGEVIHAKSDMLSLTDLWKASGSPDGRAPSDWSALTSAKEFVEMVEASFNAEKSGIIAKKGRGGGTLAHWQIALAYAKYLSPEFHMWCNSVVRGVMEGTQATAPNLSPDVLETIRCVDGICRMLSHKVTGMEGDIAAIIGEAIERQIASDPRVAVMSYVSVRQILVDEWNVPAKGRRSIQRKVFLRLQAHCLANGIKAFRCAHSGTWLFPPHEAASFVRENCAGLIREHMDRAAGQGILRLVTNRKAD